MRDIPFSLIACGLNRSILIGLALMIFESIRRRTRNEIPLPQIYFFKFPHLTIDYRLLYSYYEPQRWPSDPIDATAFATAPGHGRVFG
jgi:hypothetical protein